MKKYRIVSKIRVLGHVEAESEKAAVDQFCAANPAHVGTVMAVPDSNVALILRAYRRDNELTRQEAADKIGMTRMTLYRLERRKHKPSRATLQCMREAGIL